MRNLVKLRMHDLAHLVQLLFTFRISSISVRPKRKLDVHPSILPYVTGSDLWQTPPEFQTPGGWRMPWWWSGCHFLELMILMMRNQFDMTTCPNRNGWSKLMSHNDLHTLYLCKVYLTANEYGEILIADYPHFIQGYLHLGITLSLRIKVWTKVVLFEYELFATYSHFIQGYLHFAITLSFGIWVWTKVVYCMNINYLQSVLTLSRAIFTLPSLCPYATKSEQRWNRVWMWTKSESEQIMCNVFLFLWLIILTSCGQTDKGIDNVLISEWGNLREDID